jgi:DNA-3-methyladenine glycosylase I
VARYSTQKIDALVLDEGIVRHRGKIESTVLNAKAVRQIQMEHGSLEDFVWSFVDNTPIQNAWTSYTHAPASTDVSDALSKALKGYGCKFVGTTIAPAIRAARCSGRKAAKRALSDGRHCFRCVARGVAPLQHMA